MPKKIKVKYREDYETTDKEIAKNAIETLEWNTTLPMEDILLRVDDGHVFLSGTVESAYQKNEAKRTVEHIKGVKDITNTIDIEPMAEPIIIMDKIAEAFERSVDIDASQIQIHIKSDGHSITLTGKTNSLYEKESATAVALHAPGVTKVVNNIELK